MEVPIVEIDVPEKPEDNKKDDQVVIHTLLYGTE